MVQWYTLGGHKTCSECRLARLLTKYRHHNPQKNYNFPERLINITANMNTWETNVKLDITMEIRLRTISF